MARGTARRTGVLCLLAFAAIVVAAAIVARLDHSSSTPKTSQFRLAAETSPLPGEIATRERWNSSAFVNDNLWSEGDLQFAVWVDGEGSPVVGQRRNSEATWHSVNLGDLAGNPLATPTVADPHNVFAIGVDPAGYIHVAGNMHGDPLRYVRSSYPLTIDAWTMPEMIGAQEASASYPAFVRAPGGALLFFYRDGGAGRGDVLVNRSDGSGWERLGTLIDGQSSDESAYLQHIAVDSVRRSIHVMYLWRSGADPAGNRDVSYLRSDDDGTTWETSDASVVALPVTHRTADVVSPSQDGAPVLLNQGGLAVDEAGRPHAVFRVVRPGAGGRAAAVHVWQEPDGWRRQPVPSLDGMVGRPALVGNGRDPLLLLWLNRAADDESDLRVARLAGAATTGSVSVARLPVSQWEPTFDSAAVGRGQLRMLLPLGPTLNGQPAAPGAVVTWSIPTLSSQ